MNYLAHIQLAHVSHTSMLGNFLGDFVKGSNLAHLPAALQHGVRLHRAIDTFTDQHDIVRHLKQQFPADIRRMSGVAIDIYFDHLLANSWELYSRQKMPAVLNDFYVEIAQCDVSLGANFTRVKEGLVKYRWLHEYTHKESVERAFYQIEKRLNDRIKFASASIDYIGSVEKELLTAFMEFYPLLTQHCHTRHSDLRQTAPDIR